MDDVLILWPHEPVRVDRDRLEELYRNLGKSTAEDRMCRALEEMGARLGRAERAHAAGTVEETRRAARGIIGIAQEVGMTTLAQVAASVVRAAESDDVVALAATMARLVRIGDASLSMAWEINDLSL